ncbi:MAG TPA: N-acetyltransferase [Victivallales bacterium]|nr:N-acetyltransferase [Victivallales bacterium]
MIRKFKNDDIEQIIKIWLEASIKSHNFVPKEFWESKVTDMREIYLPMGITYVYTEKEIIKGFVSVCDNTLAAIFVSPKIQGKGIGMMLMNKAKELCPNLNLSVYKENQKSIDFYKKCGFSIVKEQVDEHTGHPELVMIYNS